MLYPVAPEKIGAFKAKLNAASDAEGLPRPTFKPLEAPPEKVLEIVSQFIEASELADPVEGFHVIHYRGRQFALVEAEWPSPLRDLAGDMVLHTGAVPVGPDPRHMWQVLFLLPETQ